MIYSFDNISGKCKKENVIKDLNDNLIEEVALKTEKSHYTNWNPMDEVNFHDQLLNG